ncbi:MAG: bile acid:sodium symporter [Cytophagales bacterium]|nr:bile acid:sodium symporter [Cytophagales bacterium]
MILLLLKISLVIFIAGNLFEMGLLLNPSAAIKGLRNYRFVSYTLFWSFIVGPALAFGITYMIPLEAPYAMGLILMGLSPCAPFLPMLVKKAHGDLGYTAAFMLIASIGTVFFYAVCCSSFSKRTNRKFMDYRQAITNYFINSINPWHGDSKTFTKFS